ncbi:MAG: hydrogenase maturation protease [Terriglobales bacterium]|jgi:hydrogenase maturation protease
MDRPTKVEVIEGKQPTARENQVASLTGRHVLIVGFGNPLRSDDGVGWHVAQQLARDLSRPGVQIVALQQLTPEVADFASRAEKVLFVDAAHEGVPGEIQCRRIAPAASSGEHSHEFSPSAILALAETLYGRYPPAWLLTVCGETFATGDSMSAAVSAAIPAVLERIVRFIAGDEKSARER